MEAQIGEVLKESDIVRYKDIYGRTNRKTLSSMPTLQPGAIGVEDLPILVQAFVAFFTPNIEAKINTTASTTMTLNNGAVATITPVNRGYGYQIKIYQIC